jgi:hypothetical protein
MMHDDRTFFEDALREMVAAPPPLAAIRNGVASDRRRRAAFRTVALLCVLAVVAVGASSRGVIAAVRALFVPTRDASVLVVRPRGVVFMDTVPSIDIARRRVPFAIYTPAASWRPAKIMVSHAGEPATTEALYRSARGDWLKITQRPATAPREREDDDLSDLLVTPTVADRMNGGAPLTFRKRMLGITDERIIGTSRIVLSRVSADVRSALADPDVEIDDGPPLRVHSDIPPSRTKHAPLDASFPMISAFDFHGHVRFRKTIDQYGRKGFMFTTSSKPGWPTEATLKNLHAKELRVTDRLTKDARPKQLRIEANP